MLSGRARVHALVRGAVARAIVGDVEKDAPSILPGSFQATRARRRARLAASPADSVVRERHERPASLVRGVCGHRDVHRDARPIPAEHSRASETLAGAEVTPGRLSRMRAGGRCPVARVDRYSARKTRKMSKSQTPVAWLRVSSSARASPSVVRMGAPVPNVVYRPRLARYELEHNRSPSSSQRFLLLPRPSRHRKRREGGREVTPHPWEESDEKLVWRVSRDFMSREENPRIKTVFPFQPDDVTPSTE